jgi:CelD/BcsL family acetyltransferase involved in cellulose biosynthesis
MLALSRRVGGQIIKRGEHEWYFRSDLARRVGRQLSGVRSDPREIEIETVTGPRAVRAIMTEWQRLFDRTPSAPPHLSPAWYQAWMAEADAASTPLVVMGRRGVEPAAVLALSVRNTFGVRAASFPGASRPGYQGILGDGEPRLCDRMARHIAQAPDFDVLVLENLSTIDRCTNNLLDSLVEYGFVRDIVPRNVCHRIELPVSFDEYFRRQRSSKSRNSLSRKARRLRTNHNVDIVRFESDELDEELIERTADVQRASWMARRGADDFSDPFYRQLVHRLGQAGLMRLWLMRIDDHDAAFVLASVHGETLIYEWTAFRLEYRDLSVGQILTAQVIRDACESGLRYFDFLHGDADYKRYWANDRHDVARVALGCGARGRLVTQALATTWRLRRNRHLRAGYRRLRNALRSDGLDGTRSEAA